MRPPCRRGIRLRLRSAIRLTTSPRQPRLPPGGAVGRAPTREPRLPLPGASPLTGRPGRPGLPLRCAVSPPRPSSVPRAPPGPAPRTPTGLESPSGPPGPPRCRARPKPPSGQLGPQGCRAEPVHACRLGARCGPAAPSGPAGVRGAGVRGPAPGRGGAPGVRAGGSVRPRRRPEGLVAAPSAAARCTRRSPRSGVAAGQAQPAADRVALGAAVPPRLVRLDRQAIRGPRQHQTRSHAVGHCGGGDREQAHPPTVGADAPTRMGPGALPWPA